MRSSNSPKKAFLLIIYNFYAEKFKRFEPATPYSQDCIGTNDPNNKPFVDHVDGNGRNNNVNHLRWATNQENFRNLRVSKNNKLDIKGVHKRGDKYVGRITVNGVLIYLGTYKLLEDAIKARQKASQELFKEFQH
ncbi:MAG: hypothetical protein EOO43_12660, partial [Flavobacterium sp.]